MKKIFLFLIPILIFSCSSSEWEGNWDAQWETLPESYPGIENMEFSMNGNFIFTKDSLTVKANGFEGCIFSSDTLAHTQSWYVANDTLFLLSSVDSVGMTYKINAISEDKIELQILEDIFVTLTK